MQGGVSVARRRLSKSVSQRYVYIRKRIAKMQRRAKIFGFLYLLATIAITALACLPLITFKEAIGVELGVMEFWKVFTQLGEGIQGKELALAVAVIYGLMLLVLVINLLRSVAKLGWLFKRKASIAYGFNRNVYAMDDMGRRFSNSFATIVASHLVIALFVLNGSVAIMGYAVLGMGAFFHFACGIPAGNVSLFDTENGVTEQRREVGNFSPFVRNLFQSVIVIVSTCLFAKVAQIRSTFDLFIAENGMANLMADPMSLITPAIHLVMLLVLIGMIYYATSTIEFDPEGSETPGRKRFLLLSLLLLLCAGGAFAYGQFVAQTEVHINVILIAVVALVALIIELALISCPNMETEHLDEVEVGTYLTQAYATPGAYVNTSAVSALDFDPPSRTYARRR